MEKGKNIESKLLKWFRTTEQPETKGGNKLQPVIKLERQLGEQIYNALQGNVVEEVLKKIKTSNSDAYWRSCMEGHSLKVQKELLEDFYNLCYEVKDKLGFEAKVDFYITGNSDVNAFSVASEDEDEPNIVNINSALFGLMTKEELKFVIGHELGHLINRDTELARLIHFVFPPKMDIPIALRYKIRLHEQLAELVADRYGYMATDDLGACVTAFFKMASGLDLVKMNVSIDELINDNYRRLEYFLNDKGVSRATHPVNPIRVQALNLFAKSASQEELEKGMDELISILLKVGDSDLDEHLPRFLASAGILVGSTDGEITEKEIEQILYNISGAKIFPRQFLDEIANGDVVQIFNDAVGNILKLNPGMKMNMLKYMIHIVISDHKMAQEEVDMLYGFGESIGFCQMEVAMAIADSIQQSYTPSLDAIC